MGGSSLFPSALALTICLSALLVCCALALIALGAAGAAAVNSGIDAIELAAARGDVSL
jgi:hypothetical protein